MVSPLIRKILIIVVTSLALPAACFAQGAHYVRVSVLEDATSISLKVSGGYEIVEPGTKKVLAVGTDLKTTVTTFRNFIVLGKISVEGSRVLIRQTGVEPIMINDRQFKGGIELLKKGSAISAINHIELEDYVKGILYHEASHYWPEEALKVQAIVSRTYAVYEMQENKAKDFDMTSDIYSQVYGGSTSERFRTNRAVDETKDQIITYQGKAIPAYFHACCGGHTEDASILWKINLPPLKGVPCGFCKESPHFNWHYVLTFGEIQEKLADAGYKIKNIKDIVVMGHDKSGRVTSLNLIAKNKELKISAKDFRNAIGPNIIKSTNFTASIVKDDVIFEGLGWGHGVGLCQWGAYFMAKQDYTAEVILRYYYPGTNVETLRF